MAESATFALKAGVWFRRGRLFIVSPDSLGTECPLSGRSSTYRPVQILEAGSHPSGRGSMCDSISRRAPSPTNPGIGLLAEASVIADGTEATVEAAADAAE